MKHQKTKFVTKTVVEVIESWVICDKCGKRIYKNTFDAFCCEFIWDIGDSFPEGQCGESRYLELCQDCAEIAHNILDDNGFNFQFKELE